MNVEEFIKANPVQGKLKVSRLSKQKENILRLKNEGYQEKKILEFLALNGVEVTQSTLNKFIRKHTVGEVAKAKKTNKDSDFGSKSGSSGKPRSGNSASGPGTMQTGLTPAAEKKRELIEINGRIIDVNYKPSWVDDDINLKDLL